MRMRSVYICLRLSVLGIFLMQGKQVFGQEVPMEINFAGITLKIEKTAQRDIQNRVNLLLEDKKSFQKKLRTADLFFPLIEEILSEAKLPPDFKYLSLLDNTSPDSLLFWQLQPDLVYQLGLRVNPWVDERMNVVTVSRAVSAYLRQNQEILQNWIFTLMSFHLTPRGVVDYFKKYFPNADLQAIQRSSVFPIVREMHPDILNAIAHYVAFKDFVGKDSQIRTELVAYTDGNNKSLQQIAEAFSLPYTELKRFNPWLKSDIIPNDKMYDLLIPMPARSPSTDVKVYTSSSGEFIYQTESPVEEEFEMETTDLPVSKTHTVQKGQSLYAISRLYQVPVKELMRLNRLNESSVIQPGQKLIIALSQQVKKIPNSNVQSVNLTHTVVKGENLYRIAKKYQVNIEEIKRWNGLNSEQVTAGQKLKINKKKTLQNEPDKVNSDKGNQGASTNSGNQTNGNNTSNGIRKINPKAVPAELTLYGIRLKLNKEAQTLIQKDVDKLLQSNSHFVQKLQRVNLYMPLIEQMLVSENLPLDFKYVPIQESAFIGNAKSSSNAVGYWQFKEESAKEVNLDINDKVDERMHILYSTQGAAKYLKRNDLIFKNWILTLLSYNMGFAGAKNHIKINYPGQNLKNISEMNINQHTHWYILKFIAHKVAFDQEIGIDPPGKKLTLFMDGNRKSLKEIAEERKSALEEMRTHNFWLKSLKVPEQKRYAVLVPEKQG